MTRRHIYRMCHESFPHGIVLILYVSARRSSARRMLVGFVDLCHSSILIIAVPSPGCYFHCWWVIREGYCTQVFKLCITVIGTGLLGWLLNIVLVLCSGPLCVLLRLFYAFIPDIAFRADLPGPSGSAFLQACNVSVLPYSW